jgi:hypothetical protein
MDSYLRSHSIESRAPGKFDQSNDYWTQAAYLIEQRLNMKNCARKIDDDNDDNDRNNYLKPVTNVTYKETHGECHFAYQPELLPSASWVKIFNQLDDHFGEEIEADPDTIKTISDYL